MDDPKEYWIGFDHGEMIWDSRGPWDERYGKCIHVILKSEYDKLAVGAFINGFVAAQKHFGLTKKGTNEV